jgi:hypothetical protein
MTDRFHRVEFRTVGRQREHLDARRQFMEFRVEMKPRPILNDQMLGPCGSRAAKCSRNNRLISKSTRGRHKNCAAGFPSTSRAE